MLPSNTYQQHATSVTCYSICVMLTVPESRLRDVDGSEGDVYRYYSRVQHWIVIYHRCRNTGTREVEENHSWEAKEVEHLTTKTHLATLVICVS